MSMRDDLQKQLEKAEAVAHSARKRYRAAKDERTKLDEKVRELCEEASEAANSVAALKAAIKALPAPPPAPKKKLESVL